MTSLPTWTQVYDPFGPWWLSALVAARVHQSGASRRRRSLAPCNLGKDPPRFCAVHESLPVLWPFSAELECPLIGRGKET